MSYLRLLPQSLRTLCARKCVRELMTNSRSYWQRRNSMFSELSSAMQAMENRMRDMDREMNRLFDDLQRSSPLKLPRSLSPFEWLRGRDIPVISKDGDSRIFKVELNMDGMEPEDIRISLKQNELTVSARREEKRSDGSTFMRENKYHYSLPKDVNVDAIRSTLSDGILTIEAPLPAVESKEIPVRKIDGSDPDSDKESKKLT